MAFKQIDDSAVAGDKPVSSVVAQRIDGNNRAAWNKRGKRAAYGWDYQDPPEVSFYAPNTDDPARACIPHIWPLSPGCTELTVKLRHNVSDENINVGVTAQKMRNALGGPIAENITTSSVSNAASDKTTTLTVDVSALTDHDEVVDLLVCLTFYSDVDSTQTSLGDGKSYASEDLRDTGLYSWAERYAVVDDDPNENGSLAAVRPHYVVKWYSDNVANGGTATSETYGDPRQVIRIENDNANARDIWYVYPAWPEVEDNNLSGGGGTEAWLWYQTLGNSKLYGVSIVESDFQVYGTAANLKVPLEPGMPLAAEPQRTTLYRPAENVYLDRTLLVASGPTTPDLTVTETGATTVALNPVSRLIDLPTSTSTYSDIAQWIVPVTNGFTYEGTNYARRVYRCQALLSLVLMRGIYWALAGETGGVASDAMTLELRLRTTDSAGANATNGETVRVDLQPFVNTAVDRDAIKHSMGLLQGFWVRTGTTDGGWSDRSIHRRNTLLGFWPSDVWHQANWSHVTLGLRDDQAGTRWMYLQARMVTPGARLDDLLLQSSSKLMCPCATVDYSNTRNFRALGE